MLVRVCEANNRRQAILRRDLQICLRQIAFVPNAGQAMLVPTSSFRCYTVLRSTCLFEQGGAAFGHVAPGGVEIAGVPGVGHFLAGQLKACRDKHCLSAFAKQTIADRRSRVATYRFASGKSHSFRMPDGRLPSLQVVGGPMWASAPTEYVFVRAGRRSPRSRRARWRRNCRCTKGRPLPLRGGPCSPGAGGACALGPRR